MTDIRALALAATPGPWRAVSRYIAALDPQTVLALLDERDALRAALEGMAHQFAYWTPGPATGLMTGGLSALEDAFVALGWDEPHDVPERHCDEPGCAEDATCGWPTRPGGTVPNGGYRRSCGRHMREGQAALAAGSGR